MYDVVVNNLCWRNTKESIKNEYEIPPVVDDTVVCTLSPIEATVLAYVKKIGMWFIFLTLFHCIGLKYVLLDYLNKESNLLMFKNERHICAPPIASFILVLLLLICCNTHILSHSQ